VTWRIRLWLADALLFLDGRAVDASRGGMRVDMSLPPEQTLIKKGEQYHLDVTRDGEPARSETVTARHADGDTIGMQFEKKQPE
jgi:hypothetical protein